MKYSRRPRLKSPFVSSSPFRRRKEPRCNAWNEIKRLRTAWMNYDDNDDDGEDGEKEEEEEEEAKKGSVISAKIASR